MLMSLEVEMDRSLLKLIQVCMHSLLREKVHGVDSFIHTETF